MQGRGLGLDYFAYPVGTHCRCATRALARRRCSSLSEVMTMNTFAVRTFAIALGSLAVAAIASLSIAADKPAQPGDILKEPTKEPAKAGPLDFKVKDIDGRDVDLSQYKGKV